MSAEVLIYTTSYCPYCTAAKQLLRKKKVAYEEVGVDDRDDMRDWLVKASGQRTVPQIFINGKPMGGFSDVSALDKAGKLDGLLAEPPAAGREALPR
jgi:glutaredoxin 3